MHLDTLPPGLPAGRWRRPAPPRGPRQRASTRLCLTAALLASSLLLIAAAPPAAGIAWSPTAFEPDPEEPDGEEGSGWISERLAPRPLPEDPTQADLGEQDYYQICMACHGDVGQGLTDEWREAWGGDSYCWESRCHAANHPPQGFVLPRSVVAVMGAGTLLAYPTAWELLQKVGETMPWWNPGSLSTEQALNVTAFLLRERAELPPGLVLDPGNAAVVNLHADPAPRGNERPLVWVLAGFLALAVLAAAAPWGRR